MAVNPFQIVRRQKLIDLLLLHLNIKECAERLNVNERTIRRDLAEPGFMEQLRQMSSSIHDEVADEVQGGIVSMQQQIEEASEKALKKLIELLNSEHQGLVLKACDSILDRNAETARNRRIEGEMHNRYTIDPVTLRHAALTARELDAPQPFELDGAGDGETD